LDFHDLGFLGLKWGEFWLGVGKESDDTAFFLEFVELFSKLTSVLLHGSLVFGESSDLGWSLLVESTLAGISYVSSPDGVGLLESLWSLNVTNDTSANHGWGIQDSDVTDNLFDGLLVSRTLFNETHDVSATSLVGDETSKVWSLGLVVSWESLDVGTRELATLFWKEGKGTFSML
jgi:hypothetical protein